MVIKNVKQERALVTFESIVQAGLMILRDDGIKRYNTNYIAEKAGVSVGSLYQYFPNKQSILKYILIKKIQEDIKNLTDIIPQLEAGSAQDFMGKFISIAWDGLLSSRDMCRELYLAPESYQDHIDILLARKEIVQSICSKVETLLMVETNSEKLRFKVQILTDSLMGVTQSLVFDDELFEKRDKMKESFINMAKSQF